MLEIWSCQQNFLRNTLTYSSLKSELSMAWQNSVPDWWSMSAKRFYFILFHFFFFGNILLLFNNFIHFLFCSILYFSFTFSKITFSIFSQEKSKTEYFSLKKTHGPWDWFVKPTMKPVFFIVSYNNGLLKTVIRECSWNKIQIENVETNLTFFMLAKLILGNKMRTAIEIISIEILIKQLKEIKVWIGITLL